MAAGSRVLADLRSFRERALREAERYGSDPWVFVRELLQNARDAGAQRVHLTTAEHHGLTSIRCRDDGSGMSFEHARRYLFALYASDKEGGSGNAGRFGVGFWSVLRFAPQRIVVRSWPPDAEGWEVELDAELGATHRVLAKDSTHGTEVLLLGGPVHDAARHLIEAAAGCGRYLLLRDGSRRPLEILVNGRTVSAPFDLPAPSARFLRGRLRGVVGLAREPRVELLAHGLSVRSASSLQDLLSPAEARSPAGLPTAQGLAPQVLLDSEEVEVMLARRDVRETPALERMVGLASRELTRLIERQLDLVHREPLWQRVDRWRRRAWPGGLWLAAVASLALAAGLFWGSRLAAPPPGPVAGLAHTPAAPAGQPRALDAGSPLLHAYRDPAGWYRGARVDPVGDAPAALDLRYTPGIAPRHFAAARVMQPGEAVTPAPAEGPYQGPRCQAGCLSIALRAEGPAVLRLPVPTGERLDPASVRVGGAPVVVQTTALDEPLLVLGAAGSLAVTYRTGPAAPELRPRPDLDTRLPEALRQLAARHQGRPVTERASRLTRELAGLVRYSRSPAAVSEERALAGGGASLADRALAVGAGDCDVQNGVLVLLLRQAGVPAHLAIGYLGQDGAALPGVHAWAEFLADDGSWRVADATQQPGPPGDRDETPPAVAGGVGTGLSAPVRLALGAGGLLGLVSAGLVWRRTRRQVRLDPGHDPSELLRGALEHPGAFAGTPAVFERRLIPTWCRRRLGLGQAVALAGEGWLFVSRQGSPLAQRAAGGGAWVIDSGTLEGRLAAHSIGGIDLDAWDLALRSAQVTPLTQAAELALREAGEPWNLRLVADLPEAGLLVLPASSFGPDFRGRRLALVQADTVWWTQAAERWRERPAEALFGVLDRLAARLRLSGPVRSRLLRPLARRVLEEATR